MIFTLPQPGTSDPMKIKALFTPPAEDINSFIVLGVEDEGVKPIDLLRDLAEIKDTVLKWADSGC